MIPGGPAAIDKLDDSKSDAKKPESAASATASASTATAAAGSVAGGAAESAAFDSRLPIAKAAAKLCGKALYSDVTFVVGKEELKIPAHRFILAARSPVFEALLYHPLRPLQKLTKPIHIKDVDSAGFMCMLRAIYSDKPGLTHDNILSASQCAKKYQVESLRAACINFSKRGITATTACALYERSPELALAFIEANTSKVINTAGFRALSERSLCALLRSNKLDVSEPKLFKAVLKWGAAECARRDPPLDPAKAEDLRAVLKNALLLIRFPLFTTEQISLHVTKSQLLTPEQLLGVFSLLGGNKSAKCAFSSVPREAAAIKFAFDAERKSQQIALSVANTTATLYARAGWVLGATPIKRGVTAWRITFPAFGNGQYVTYGISAQKNYFDARTSYTDGSVYAIDTLQQWYRAGTAQGTHYLTVGAGQSVDVMLDLTQKQVVFQNVQTQQRHQIDGVAASDAGYVPHFHMNRNGCSIRVATIRPNQFGKAN